MGVVVGSFGDETTTAAAHLYYTQKREGGSGVGSFQLCAKYIAGDQRRDKFQISSA